MYETTDITTVGELRKAVKKAPGILVNSATLWGAALAVTKAEVLRMVEGIADEAELDNYAIVLDDGTVSI